jgi:hypothetical protein
MMEIFSNYGFTFFLVCAGDALLFIGVALFIKALKD